MKHLLKTHPEYFQASWVGDKNFEIRLNDRNFKERDEIVLQEWEPADDKVNGGLANYTGREIEGVIVYLTRFSQKKNHVVFSFRETSRQEG